MGVSRTLDYLAIGHVTHDVLLDGQQVVGSTVSYAAYTAVALEQSVGVLTSAGPDFDRARLEAIADVTWIPASQTTTFANTYSAKSRQQSVYGVATTLQRKHVPQRGPDISVAHIGLVLAECTVDLVSRFASHAFVGVTPQGWLRMYDADRKVIPTSWDTASQILSQASAVVLSLEDVGGNHAQLRHFARQTAVLIATQGDKGGLLFLNGEAQPFPAIKVKEVDPTGAGDIFATAFFIALAARNPPTLAAKFAACLSRYSVTRRGLNSVPSAAEVKLCVRILSNG